MSNYNELKLTYQDGRQETIILDRTDIFSGEYQERDIVAVEVPEIVERIQDYAFCDNNNLSAITLNEGLLFIQGQAFQHGVYSAVTIPSTVAIIGENAFNISEEQYDGFAGNLYITCLASTPPMIEDPEGIIFGNPDLLTIYVPAESVAQYKDTWGDYADKIQAIPAPTPTPITTLDITAAYVGDTEVARLYLGDNLVYGTEPKPEEDPMLRTPLTLELTEQGTGTTHGIGLRLTGVTSTAERDQYRRPLMYVLTHNGEKTTGYLDLTEAVSSSAVTSLMTGLTLGDTVEFYAKEKQGALAASTDIYEMITYYTGDKYAVYGNVNSLLITKDEFDDFDNAAFIASAYTFQGLFRDKTALDFGTPSSEKHILLPEPTNGLQESCYRNMFRATSIAEAPELPATTLAEYCYTNIFLDCTSLTKAPELPAMTLTEGCYTDMFYGCSSLTSAPELPAMTLAESCYYNMFRNCTSLTTAPELPATTLASNCYAYMFNGCRYLNLLDCRATDITASACTTSWVQNVASTGTFIKDPNMTSWTTGTNGIPSNWTVIDAVGIHLLSAGKSIFEDESGEQTIAILPFENWTASTSDSWITFDKATGTSEDRSFSFNVTSTDEPRTGTITFTTNSNSVTFTLYQNDLKNRLTFNILSDGRITWKKTETAAASGWNVSLYYRKNDAASWTSFAISSGGTSINVSAGDTLEFAGYSTRQTLASSTTMYCWLGDSTAQFEARGNIMSLLTSSLNYSGATTLASAYTFYGLFSGCTGLTSAERLILPATTLTSYCYEHMFDGCTSLTTAPELPATTLAFGCYGGMFSNCTNLTTAPELPATTLATSCYEYMFSGCRSLTAAPELPATTLAGRCYYGMFSNCSSLTTAPALSATTLADGCYGNMFSGCRSLTAAPELTATTLANSCYDSMFSGCTSLTSAPTLPATALANNCYSSMFFKCTGLTSAPELPATTLASSCYGSMFAGCTSLITAPELPATTLAQNCYNSMFSGCTSLTTAPSILPATTLVSSCYQYMFYGCTSLTTAPEILATSYSTVSYGNVCSYMFYNCSNLNYIKCMFLTAPSGSYNRNPVYYWVSGVAASGTFVRYSGVNWPTGNSGIPTGWTVVDATE